MFWLFIACAHEVKVVASPESLDFGEVHFGAEMPEGGWALQQEVTFSNAGEDAVVLTLPEPNADLCLDGFADDAYPADLGQVNAGSAYVIRVGICAYQSGEATTEQEFPLVVNTPEDTVSVTVTFTPIRDNE